MHLVGYLYEDYHDARSLEHKAENILKNTQIQFPAAMYSNDTANHR
jgi:hypothetical protein